MLFLEAAPVGYKTQTLWPVTTELNPSGINQDVLDNNNNKKNQRVLGQSRNEIFHDGICIITITEMMAFVHVESGGSWECDGLKGNWENTISSSINTGLIIKILN